MRLKCYDVFKHLQVTVAETALLRFHNDVTQSIDTSRAVLIVLLDLTAAFDTINHDILRHRLHVYGNGIDCEAHVMLSSCLRGRTQFAGRTSVVRK